MHDCYCELLLHATHCLWLLPAQANVLTCRSTACSSPVGPMACAMNRLSWPLPQVASTATSPGCNTWPTQGRAHRKAGMLA